MSQEVVNKIEKYFNAVIYRIALVSIGTDEKVFVHVLKSYDPDETRLDTIKKMFIDNTLVVVSSIGDIVEQS